MTETQSPVSPPAPNSAHQLVRADLPNLLATQHVYTRPAAQYLEQAFHAHGEKNPGSRPVAEVVHYDVICEWCRDNPEQAARIVLASVYLVNGTFVAQVPPDSEPEAEAAGDQVPTPS